MNVMIHWQMLAGVRAGSDAARPSDRGRDSPAHPRAACWRCGTRVLEFSSIFRRAQVVKDRNSRVLEFSSIFRRAQDSPAGSSAGASGGDPDSDLARPSNRFARRIISGRVGPGHNR